MVSHTIMNQVQLSLYQTECIIVSIYSKILIVINYLATHFNDVIRNQAAMNGYPMMKQVDSENPRQVLN